jgi:hypothetical protein
LSKGENTVSVEVGGPAAVVSVATTKPRPPAAVTVKPVIANAFDVEVPVTTPPNGTVAAPVNT